MQQPPSHKPLLRTENRELGTLLQLLLPKLPHHRIQLTLRLHTRNPVRLIRIKHLAKLLPRPNQGICHLHRILKMHIVVARPMHQQKPPAQISRGAHR